MRAPGEWRECRYRDKFREEVCDGDFECDRGIARARGVGQKSDGVVHCDRGVVYCAGIFAIAEPFAAGLGVTLLVGWLLVIGAVAHFIAAFKGGGARHVILQLLVGSCT